MSEQFREVIEILKAKVAEDTECVKMRRKQIADADDEMGRLYGHLGKHMQRANALQKAIEVLEASQ